MLLKTARAYPNTSRDVRSEMSSYSSGNSSVSGFLFAWPIHECDAEPTNLVWKAEAPTCSLLISFYRKTSSGREYVKYKISNQKDLWNILVPYLTCQTSGIFPQFWITDEII